MSGINIEKVDHIGIRVRDLDRALAFYQALGFKLAIRVTFDPVAILRNEHGVEINLILNANSGDPEKNILMDLGDKYAGYTHAALRVASINGDHDIFGTHGILELAPFFDVGRVAHNLNFNPLSQLHPVGGVGFRGIAEPFVVGFVDVGYGGEGIAVFSGINYPF